MHVYMLGAARCLRVGGCWCPVRVRNEGRAVDSQARIAGGPLKSASTLPPMDREPSGSIDLREWQGWGTTSPVPAMVVDVIEDLKLLEGDVDAQMSFGGLGGKLQGDFKVEEDKKHRAKYQALTDSEKKLQFFSARQIACRLLGSRSYLCQKCWLAKEDCMCSGLISCSLWNRIKFWIYMHPKDFLRQNNTGKLLWQTFGMEAACLCLFGIHEHEAIMWNSFKHAGKGMVWCLYPNKNASPKSVHDTFSPENPDFAIQSFPILGDGPMNFILIDGTWSNSAAMFRRLKDHAKSTWGDEDLQCISLSMPCISVMHKLRPQPSWDRTCTAAAAIALLLQLHDIPAFSVFGLDKQSEALGNALDVLLDALTTRRLRMGRSITRRERSSRRLSISH